MKRCKYNLYIDCENQICGKCGWNPDIESKRRKENKKALSKNNKFIVGEKKEYKKDVNTFEEV